MQHGLVFLSRTPGGRLAAPFKRERGFVRYRLACSVLALLLLASRAIAAEAGGNDKEDETAKTGVPSPSVATSLPSELADPGGLRQTLAQSGVTFKLNYTGEVLGNVSGGLRRGSVYDGQIELVLNVDLEKQIGWKGATMHVNGFQIQGTRISPADVGSLGPVSSIEALGTIRLYEAWLEQKLLDDKLSVKFGQLGADTEFVTSATASHFVNNTFGFPVIDSVNLPSGGPNYPLATPGVRVQVDPVPGLSLLAAVYNGDPAGPGSGDPEKRDLYGVNFRLSDPPLWFGEAQYKYNQEKTASGLPGVLKIGTWYHDGKFDNVRFGTDGLPLAFGNGIAAKIRGDWGVYGVIDQQIWRLSEKDPDKGANMFVRISGSPSEQNEVDFYVDGGVTFTGVVPRRPDDIFGVAFAYSSISGNASAADRDSIAAGTGAVMRDYEALLEVTYQAQIVPGWILQPDLQYIWHPGGHAPVSNAPDAPAIPNAVILGLRTVVNY